MSCPVSTPSGWSGRDWLITVEEGLEAVVGGWVVGGVVLPAAPYDVGPGAGQDAGGVGMVAAAGVADLGEQTRPLGRRGVLLSVERLHGGRRPQRRSHRGGCRGR